jgi:hypothetical protein
LTEPILCKKNNGWKSRRFYFDKLEQAKRGDDPWAAVSWMFNYLPCPELEKAEKTQQEIREEECQR